PPAERSARVGCATGDPPADAGVGRGWLVDDGDQLQVAVPERHDPVGGAPAGMPAALDRGQAVACLELPPRGREVGDREQHMVQLHASERTAPAGWDAAMTVLRSVVLSALAALAEIGGSWLVW